MSWLVPWVRPRVLGPLLCGGVLAAILQVTDPQLRLYASVSPGLLTGTAGLLVAVVLAVVTRIRQQAAVAAEAAAREATAAAVRDRQRFLMRLDHELKNPLTAIRAGLVNLKQAGSETYGSAGVAATLASVSAQADRITHLVSDLRKLADLETQEIETAAVHLPSLLQEVVEAACEIPGARERAIRVTVPQAPWPLPPIEGDRDLLFIAIENLVTNAVKFCAAGDTIEIRASEEDAGLLLEVADTGAGIPSDEIGQVWQELARGRAARSLPGTGIGLALVRVIVSRHGGQVAIRSRDGRGTVVSIRLPGSARARTASAVAGPRHRRDTHDTVPI